MPKSTEGFKANDGEGSIEFSERKWQARWPQREKSKTPGKKRTVARSVKVEDKKPGKAFTTIRDIEG